MLDGRGPPGPTGTAGLDAGDLEVLVDLHGDLRAVTLGHVGLVGRALGVVLDPLDGAAGDGSQGGRLHLVGGVAGEQRLRDAVGDVAALGRVEVGGRRRRCCATRGSGARSRGGRGLGTARTDQAGSDHPARERGGYQRGTHRGFSDVLVHWVGLSCSAAARTVRAEDDRISSTAAVGQRAHLVVGAVLDGVGDEHPRRVEAEGPAPGRRRPRRTRSTPRTRPAGPRLRDRRCRAHCTTCTSLSRRGPRSPRRTSWRSRGAGRRAPAW